MKQALVKLHISVFLAGFTGILGALIQLNEGLLTWYRIAITVITLFAWLAWQGKLERISTASVFRLLGTGALIALHWVCFYGSIKAANISIGLVCFASVGLFTSVLEPPVTGKRFSLEEFSLGLLSLIGIYLIFYFDGRYRTGILLGIASSILGAIFSVLNKRYVNVARPQTIMLYELSGGLTILTVLMPLYLAWFPVTSIVPSVSDWLWLLALAWLCTILAMDLMLQALRKVSAFTQNLTLNLEPVYGIAMAFLFFHENRQVRPSFYWGIGLIALSVIIQMARIMRRKDT